MTGGAAGSEAGIEVVGLAKRFGPRGETEAVRGVSFSVPAGQICGYLGPNGAGKTTTLRMIAGILAPDSGSVRIGGHEMGQDALRAKSCLGFVPESGGLYGLLSVLEHLHLVADLHDLDPTVAAERIDRLLDLFDLGELALRRVDTLSKGQRQKVALCTAFVHEPKVILLDEPLDGLDAKSARTVKDLLHGLADRGRAILFSSHILDVVERICHRAIILHRGAVVADAPTRELVARSRDASLEAAFHELTRSGESGDRAGEFLRALDDNPHPHGRDP